MSGNHSARIERRQLWRKRSGGRLVAIAAVDAGLVSAFDPERGEEAAFCEARFRARFEYVGVTLRDPSPDAPPSALDAAALRGLKRRSAAWLRELVTAAEARGVAELARLAR